MTARQNLGGGGRLRHVAVSRGPSWQCSGVRSSEFPVDLGDVIEPGFNAAGSIPVLRALAADHVEIQSSCPGSRVHLVLADDPEKEPAPERLLKPARKTKSCGRRLPLNIIRGGQCSTVAGSVPPQKMQKGLSFNKAYFDFLRREASPMASSL
jgi:hypothetical protein